MCLTCWFRKHFWGYFLSAFLILKIPAAWADTTHIVKKGESLSAISAKYRVSVSAIQEANELDGPRLQIGQSLIIPRTLPEGPTPPKSPKRAQQNAIREGDVPETHVVKSGDTLFAIAKRYGRSVQDLQELNGLRGTRLKIGQVLRLKVDREAAEEGGDQEGTGNCRSAATLKESPAIPISLGMERAENGEINALIKVAESFLGVKYRRGGTDVKTGLDCSAFVQKVFGILGKDLPRTAREQFGVGMEVARDALRMGDLVFFKRTQAKRPAHVGIYLGNDRFIHSSTTQRKIRVDSLNARYFATRFIGARRIQEVEAPPTLPKPEGNDFPISLPPLDPPVNPDFQFADLQPISFQPSEL